MTNHNTISPSSSTKQRMSQLDHDSLSQDFTQERKRAQSELARSVHDEHRMRIAAPLGLWLMVFLGALIVLVFYLIKFVQAFSLQASLPTGWQ